MEEEINSEAKYYKKKINLCLVHSSSTHWEHSEDSEKAYCIDRLQRMHEVYGSCCIYLLSKCTRIKLMIGIKEVI